MGCCRSKPKEIPKPLIEKREFNIGRRWPKPEEISWPPRKGDIVIAKVIGVYDGDTCTIIYDYNNTYIKAKIRIMGVDTPEIKVRGKNIPKHLKELEQKAGNKVASFVRDLILDKEVEVELIKWDKWGGRIDGIVYVDNTLLSELLSEILIRKGYAKPYDGGKKKKWLELELNQILTT